jgi:hypothetical protein
MQQPVSPLAAVDAALRRALDGYFPDAGYTLTLFAEPGTVPTFDFQLRGWKCSVLASMSIAAAEGTARSIAKTYALTPRAEKGTA